MKNTTLKTCRRKKVTTISFKTLHIGLGCQRAGIYWTRCCTSEFH